MIKRAKELFKPLQRVKNINLKDFEEKFAYPQVPVVLEGMSSNWSGRKRWLLESLQIKYGHHYVTVKKSLDKSEIKMKLKDFISYLRVTNEEHAYYLTDWVFGDDFPEMKNDYEVLPHFKNWLDDLPEELNPKFSWMYIGPKKSYSRLHLDVLLTNAWNILIQGKKLWLFFPPNGKINTLNREFDPCFPGYSFPNVPGGEGYYAVQKPGEIMFTPGSWYHQVYNMENSVALTENYINHTNYKIVEKHLLETSNKDVLSILDSLKKKFHIH